MSRYSTETVDVIRDRILANTKTDLAKMEGSTTYNNAFAMAIDLAQAYSALDMVEDLVFIKNTFGEFLDERINEFGPKRKLGENATGEVYFEGTIGATIENGTK